MLKVLDDLTCQLFHGQWAEVVSYSRQGAWKCTKPGCGAQARHDADLAAHELELQLELQRRARAGVPAAFSVAAHDQIRSTHAA